MVKKEAGNNCVRDNNEKILFAEDGRTKVWKEHMEAIMNEENSWNVMVKIEVIEGPVEPFAIDELEKRLGTMKSGKDSGLTGIVKEHLADSPHSKQVILEITNEILNEKDMPHDWKTSSHL